MDWLLMIIGILIVLLGLVILRFRLVNLLSNVEGLRVIDKEKATRYTTCYLAILGVCFMTLGYLIEELSKGNLILIIACFIPLNLVVLIPYMVALHLTKFFVGSLEPLGRNARVYPGIIERKKPLVHYPLAPALVMHRTVRGAIPR